MTDQDPLEIVLDLLKVERLEVDLFRGRSPDETSQRVFGGQVIGQALMSAYQTVENRRCHSLHAYFIRPGDPNVPIIYQVDHARDGRSFTTRRVVAIQHGKQIFNLAASFQVDEEGWFHEAQMPDVPGPEGLKTRLELRKEAAHLFPEPMRAQMTRARAIEMRPINPGDFMNPEPMPAENQIWFRAIRCFEGTENDAIHQCLMAYASDMSLLDSGTRPHAITWQSGDAMMASLDHAMWFHAPARADEWLLYTQDSPHAGGARSFNRGMIFKQDGTLVASVAQEGLMRPRRKG
ncbi:MAG: acyl-CoA thioesterase II [Pseudomonadota bacterium]